MGFQDFGLEVIYIICDFSIFPAGMRGSIDTY